MADEHSRTPASCLELTARTAATNYLNRPFQALSENVFIRADIASSAVETFCFMGYISLLYLVTLRSSVIGLSVCLSVGMFCLLVTMGSAKRLNRSRGHWATDSGGPGGPKEPCNRWGSRSDEFIRRREG